MRKEKPLWQECKLMTQRAMHAEQDDMRHAENAGLTSRMPENSFEEMLNAIWDSLRDLASYKDKENSNMRKMIMILSWAS